ncbi:MAG: carboxypeptidase-like regulatory domain-containing protein, partial [Bacteroidales bacterium]|nr:carboxypeptidase-like regulatory domain-containing protein [Bacteroidales bacterium]
INTLVLCTLSFLLFSCSDDEDKPETLNAYSLSGFITDQETRQGILGATVKISSLDDLEVRTDHKGYYSFGELPRGDYKITVSKYDHESKEVEFFINGNPATHSVDVRLKKIDKPNIGIIDYIADTDGIALKLEASKDTEMFFWIVYESDRIPSNEQLVEDLLNRMPYTREDLDEWGTYIDFAWNMVPEKSYTFFAVGVDIAGHFGDIFKLDISTKSTANQPVATIDIENINSELVTVSTYMNELCDRYCVLYSPMFPEMYNYPRIYWAASAYFYDNTTKFISENIVSEIVQIPLSYYGVTEGVLFSLGYDNKRGVNSSLVNVAIYSSETNSIIEVPHLKSETGLEFDKRNLNLPALKTSIIVK